MTAPQPQPVPVLASTVLAVLMRVAGPVPTEVHPYALGHPEQQVSVRIGDALMYLTEPGVAARIRQQWDAAQYLACQRLPERVSQTWLAPRPGTYPVAVALRLTGQVDVHTQWITGRPRTRTPAHWRVQINQLVWQVCDQQAWRRIGDAWFAAQQHLHGQVQSLAGPRPGSHPARRPA